MFFELQPWVAHYSSSVKTGLIENCLEVAVAKAVKLWVISNISLNQELVK